jgi:hypothetical protein
MGMVCGARSEREQGAQDMHVKFHFILAEPRNKHSERTSWDVSAANKTQTRHACEVSLHSLSRARISTPERTYLGRKRCNTYLGRKRCKG